MSEIRLKRIEQGQTKIRNVPIAVTPEDFWCCPSYVVFQKTIKAQNPLNKAENLSPSDKNSVQKYQNPPVGRKPSATPLRAAIASDDHQNDGPDASGISTPAIPERVPRPKAEGMPRKVVIEYGEPGTSDVKVVLLGKEGICVKLSVHRNVLVENSNYFADKFLEQESNLPCLEIADCEYVEIYVETVGLMYCKEMKRQLIKQSVSRVLRILKVAKLLGFNKCIQSCLEYLEAVPWVGEEEVEKVVSSVLRLQSEDIGVTPILKRVSSDVTEVPKDTISLIMELVLKSNDERGRREMKSIILKLLRESNNLLSCAGSADICCGTIYSSCRSCLSSLLSLFKQATDLGSADIPIDNKETVVKRIALEADNVSWLLDILADRHSADEFAQMWASQQELSILHKKLPKVSRYHVSCIIARLFVGIGRGEILPSKDTRHLLLQTWLQPLIDDYSWLQHGCRSFDRKVVEEGIGRTILTLPLEDQQSILLGWLGRFLKASDNCPNLQRAFEVWWRRTFIRPHVDLHDNQFRSDSLATSK